MNIFDNGSKFEQTPFQVFSYFSVHPTKNWQLKWNFGTNLLWRINGNSGQVTTSVSSNVKGVQETRQEVVPITDTLYMAMVWVTSAGQQTVDIGLDVAGQQQNIIVDITSWSVWGQWSGCGMNMKKTRKRNTINKKEVESIEEVCDITVLTEPNFCKRSY